MGERLAASFLRSRGASLVATNLRLTGAEADLVARWGDFLVAVEVKTRVGEDPAWEWSPEQGMRLRRSRRFDRIDLVAVELDREGARIRWVPGVL